MAAYSTLARGGEWIEPSWAPVANAAGTHRDDREHRTLVSPLTAYWITDVLSDDSAREYIFGRGGSLEFPFPVAVKTGTSQAYHDNWTIGFTKDVTVGVWVGNFDRTPLKSSTGVTGAAPIFHAVMLAATQRLHGAAGFDARAIVAVPGRHRRARSMCALRHAGEPLVPGAPARAVATLQRSALQLASPERRRAARYLAAAVPPVGAAERFDDRDGTSSDERFDPSGRRPAVTDRSRSARARDREPSSWRDFSDRSDAAGASSRRCRCASSRHRPAPSSGRSPAASSGRHPRTQR